MNDGLVGRDDVVGMLTRELASSRGRVVLHGTSGVGKSAVAMAVADALAPTAAAAVAVVRASSTAHQLPFGALWSSIGEPRGLADAQRSAVEQVGRRLARLGRRVVFVVDDWDQLDGASRAAIGVADELVDISILATVRSDEPASAGVLSALRHDGWKLVELDGLDSDDAVTLAAGLVGVAAGSLAPTMVEDLWRWTRGNPLFVREVIDAALAGGHLAATAAGVTMGAGFRVAGHLSEVVAARVDRLSGQERELFAAVAIAGELDGALAARLGIGDASSPLAERGVLVRDADDLRAAHPLAAEAMRARLSPIDVAVMCRRLAFASRPGTSTDVLRVVHWHEVGGVAPPPELLLAAARAARQRGLLRAAERYARRVHETDPGDCFAVVMLGEVLAAGGDAERADAVLADGQEACAMAVDSLLLDAPGPELNLAIGALAYVTLVRMTTGFWAFDRIDVAATAGQRCRAVLDSVADRFPASRGLAAAIGDEIRAEHALELGFAGDLAAALGLCEEILDPERSAARRQADDGGGFGARAEARASLTAAAALDVLGRPEEGLEHARRALAAAAAVPEGFGREQLESRANLAIVDAELSCGNVMAAHTVAAAELDAADGDVERLMFAEYAAGRVAFERDQLDAAVGHLETAYRLDRARPPRGGSQWPAVWLARVLAETGRVDDAVAVLDAAAPRRDDVAVAVPLGLALAAVHVARGEPETAVGSLEAALSHVGRLGHRASTSVLAYELVRRRGTAADIDRLLETSGGMEQGLPRLLHRLATARRAGPDALRGLTVEMRARGLVRMAVDAELMAAASARRRGERCGPAAITRRQREIAALAVDGLSNAAIADRLGLSVRTVANQLQHVYTATGSTRSTLTRLLPSVGGERA